MSRRKTTEEFIAEARSVHGDKYDYSETEYVNAKTKVKIICPEHGVFEQNPNNHLSGKGCYYCRNRQISESKTYSQDEFIRRAKSKHGNKYDYSRVEYKHNKRKVIIICFKHGEFEQTPNNHLNGAGCPICFDERRSEKQRLTTKEFIQRAREVHGEKYDYSKVKYINNHTNVKIICPKHGVFYQKPANHLLGKGCKKCAVEKQVKSRLLTTDEFIKRAREVHGNKYDYSQVKYVNAKTKVKIICPIHGEFWQTPNKHIYCCQGCLDCGIQKCIDSKRINGTFNKSQPEENLYKLLCDKFGVDDVIRQYRDKRYLFNCDFYVKSLDLFIELNASQYHNGHFFNENNPDDLEQLKVFQEKASESEYNQYHEIIRTWTKRDPLKKKTAEENNLNYKVFWDNNLKDAKSWLNSI